MKLVIVPAALADLQKAADFYSSNAGVELGQAFVAEFERATTLLLANPKLGAQWRNGDVDMDSVDFHITSSIK